MSFLSFSEGEHSPPLDPPSGKHPFSLTDLYKCGRILFLRLLLPILLVLSMSFPALANPIPSDQWTPAAKLWTARSCVGEAGFHAVEECLAIAWVYATRSKMSSGSYVHLVKRYSSAIKEHEKHRRGWIFELDLAGRCPSKWPTKLNWKKHRGLWMKLLRTLDHWAWGTYGPNPVPGADHFGGKMDTPGSRWTRIEPAASVRFFNFFYKSPRRGE